jgi:transposase
VLRGYLRQRENLVAAAATCIQHMQKALTEMNIQLANVISDISGTTGLAILYDIVRGERDPYKLAMHKHSRIRASRQEIARSLQGTWRQELLFVLEQSLDLYQTYQQKIQTCDERIDGQLRSMEPKIDPVSQPIPEPRRGKDWRGLSFPSPPPPSSIISNNPATADSVSRKEIVLTQRYCPGFRTGGFTIGQVRRRWTQSLR